MTAQIKFGTSGWRAVMAEEFTYANVRRAVKGIAMYVASQKPKNAKVIIGRDPRFLGETFCTIAAEILAEHGVIPLVIAEAAPTPAISYAVTQAKADGAINFTASHNPPEYNGIKFSTPDGAPALPEVTTKIEAEIASADGSSVNGGSKKVEAQPLDPRRMYLSRLREIVDLGVITKAGLRVVFDPLWGAARGYPDALLKEGGVDVVHGARLPGRAFWGTCSGA
jgi:phosphoglucomutase